MSARRAITLVAWREINERLRSPVFLVSTIAMLVIVGGMTAFSSVVRTEKTYRVDVVAASPQGLDAALQRAAKPFEAKVKLTVTRSRGVALRQLREKQTDAVLFLVADRVAFRAEVDTKLAAITDTAVRAIRHHLPPAPELTAVTIGGPKATSTDAEVLAALLGASMLLGTLAVYGQWVLTGVVEERANRVVELVLSSVRPRHLLAGKVIGIGLVGLAQVALIGGLAAVLLAAGLFDAPASLGGSVALVIPWFAMGYALYAVVYAVAGAVASRAQDVNSAGTPVTYTMLAFFFAGYASLTANSSSALSHLLTVFPLSAPFVLPARSALVGVPIWEHALALVIALSTTYALVRLAGRIYGQGLLRSGPRLGLRSILRLAGASPSH
jgi:ABC-2 type transport system permease protein